MKTAYVHPEARKAVKAYFDKLHTKYPNIDGLKKWQLSKEYIYALAIADTAILKQELGL